MRSYQPVSHRTTVQSSLNAAWSQGTRNLTVPLSGSWASQRAWRVKLRQAGAVGYGVRKGERVNSGELDTEELLIWSRGADVKGEEPAFPPWLPGTGDLCHMPLCLGSWACQDRVSRVTECTGVCFCQVRDTALRAVCYIWDRGRTRRWVDSLHTRCPDTPGSELSHG